MFYKWEFFFRVFCCGLKVKKVVVEIFRRIFFREEKVGGKVEG